MWMPLDKNMQIQVFRCFFENNRASLCKRQKRLEIWHLFFNYINFYMLFQMVFISR